MFEKTSNFWWRWKWWWNDYNKNDDEKNEIGETFDRRKFC